MTHLVAEFLRIKGDMDWGALSVDDRGNPAATNDPAGSGGTEILGPQLCGKLLLLTLFTHRIVSSYSHWYGRAENGGHQLP